MQFVVKADAAAIGDTKVVMEADAPKSASMAAGGGEVSVIYVTPLPKASNLPTGESWAWFSVEHHRQILQLAIKPKNEHSHGRLTHQSLQQRAAVLVKTPCLHR